jgi:hypothetical protein
LALSGLLAAVCEGCPGCPIQFEKLSCEWVCAHTCARAPAMFLKLPRTPRTPPGIVRLSASLWQKGVLPGGWDRVGHPGHLCVSLIVITSGGRRVLTHHRRSKPPCPWSVTLRFVAHWSSLQAVPSIPTGDCISMYPGRRVHNAESYSQSNASSILLIRDLVADREMSIFFAMPL